MPAFDGTDLLPLSSTDSNASRNPLDMVVSHNSRAIGDKRSSISSVRSSETGREDGALEVPASRSPYGDALEYMHSLSLTPSSKVPRASRNSFGASLPIPHLRRKSRLSSVTSEDGDRFSFLRASSPPVHYTPEDNLPKTEQLPTPTVTAARNMAFAFDIDGVLVRGNRLIPKGRRALQILNGDNSLGIKIPHIFLTNGGGRLEADRCAQLTQILNTGSPVLVNQLIQSHTPMQALKEYYSTVLIVGGEGDRCKRIAQAYGFSDVIVPHDIVAWDATIVPFKKLSPSEVTAANPRDFSSVNINAILVFSSSRDYATDLQIIMDLLRSSHGRLGTVASDPVTERIPIYFSQGDLVFPTEHFQPRMSQGMFRIALEAMYKTLTGLELERVVYGKPEHATYAYADELLASWVDDLYGAGAKLPENVYMIGDNPASDICGGNMYGWHTCLVRTGVFQGGEGENDGIHPASFGVFDDVLEAVTAAMRKELGLELRFEWNARVNSKAQEKD